VKKGNLSGKNLMSLDSGSDGEKENEVKEGKCGMQMLQPLLRDGFDYLIHRLDEEHGVIFVSGASLGGKSIHAGKNHPECPDPP